MEEIVESIINGQRKQALKQLMHSQYTLEDLFEYLLYHKQPKEVIVMYRVALSIGYLKFGEGVLNE